MSQDYLKPSLHILACGHVDTGKSTTFGHLLVLTGGITRSEIESATTEAETIGKQTGKNMATFKFAFTLDTSPDERKRGVTIDLKRRTLETTRFRFVLLDGPGHSDFVRNMITGASIADVAILFTSAKEGEFETSIRSAAESSTRTPGQTREHCQLCKVFGVEQAIVVVNKMDQVDWSQSRFQIVSEAIVSLLDDVGFRSSTTQVVPVSGLTGDNLVSPSENMNWCKGPTLLQALDNLHLPKTALAHKLPLRIPIQKVLRVQGIGHVVLGRVETGILHIGDSVGVQPGGSEGYVRSIQMWHKDVNEAWPGDGVGINIRGMNPTFLKPGSVLCDRQFPVKIASPSNLIEAEIVVFDHFGSIRAGNFPTLFAHTGRVPCRIVGLEAKLDQRSMEIVDDRPSILRNGDVGLIRIAPLHPFAIERYVDFPQLGRFALRDNGKTIAAGRVSEIHSISQTVAREMQLRR
jgi:elongation factor 1-alpha